MDLQIISEKVESVIAFTLKLFGDRLNPAPIADDKALNSAQENIASLQALKKAVADHYQPLKAEAKKPYETVIQQEKGWLETISGIYSFIDTQVRAYNDMLRAARLAEEKAAAEKRAIEAAEAERARIQALHEDAVNAQNLELAAELEGQKIAVRVEATVLPVTTPKMKSVGTMNTMTEADSIEDLEITSHDTLAAALLETGKGGFIILDNKTLTAIKKWLLANKEVTAFPGLNFRRSVKTTYRSK